MGQEIVYCGRCQTQLRTPDFEKGKAFRMGTQVFCEGCIREVLPSFSPEDAKRPAGSTPPAMRAMRPSTRRMAGASGTKSPPYLPLAALAFFLAAIAAGVALKSGGSATPSENRPADAAAAEAQGAKALHDAKVFASANPDDYAGQIVRFEQAQLRTSGTAVHPEAQRELKRALERRDELNRTMEEVEKLIQAACKAGDFSRALELADLASKRSPESRWAPWSEAQKRVIESEKVPPPSASPTPTPPGTAARGPFQQSPEGAVWIEAENYSSAVSTPAHAWASTTAYAGFSGVSAMQVIPDQNVSSWKKVSDAMASAPRLDFEVTFVKTGPHYVWVRGQAPPPSPGRSDSLHLGLDGKPAVQGVGKMKSNEYRWENQTLSGQAAVIDISKPGVHVLNVWPREDGVVVDKIYISIAPEFVGSDVAASGPSESPRSPK